jgi:hypothetical protein
MLHFPIYFSDTAGNATCNATYAVVNKKGNKKPPVCDTYAEVDLSKKKKGGKKGAAPTAPG